MPCNIERKLVDFVQTVATDPSIDAETDLVLENILDSLLLMDLVILIENDMGVVLKGDEIAPRNFRTIEELASLVRVRATKRFMDDKFVA